MKYHLVKNYVFIDSFIEAVEEYSFKSDDNRYILTEKRGNYALRNSEKVQYAPLVSKAFKRIFQDFTETDQLIIHFLDAGTARWLANADVPCKVKWVFWGADIFKLLEYVNPDFKQYDSITEQLNASRAYEGLLQRSLPYKLSYRLYYSYMNPQWYRSYKTCAGKIDTLYHYNTYDLAIINDALKSKMQFEHFYYLNKSNREHQLKMQMDTSPGVEMVNREKVNVFVGNAATLTNNHLDIFSKIPFVANVDIWCPLSTGKRRYANYVKEFGRNKYGSNFHPIEELMSYEKYLDLLKQMNFAVMGHNRSQAAGNVIDLIMMGKEIFMKEDSPLYSFLVDAGVKVLNLNSAKELNFNNLTPNAEVAQMNARVVKALFSETRMQEIYSRLF